MKEYWFDVTKCKEYQLIAQFGVCFMCDCIMCVWCCDQVWLSHLSDEMKNTLQELLKSCLRDAKSGKGGLDPNKYPSQVYTDLYSIDVVFLSQRWENYGPSTHFNCPWQLLELV